MPVIVFLITVSSLTQGAEVSELPFTMTDKLSSVQGTKLTAANGSHIRTIGTCTISLWFNKWHFQSTFTIAEVSQPLMGADFLRAHSNLVDDMDQPTSNWPSWSQLYHFIWNHNSSTSSGLHCLSRRQFCQASGRLPRHHYTLICQPNSQKKCQSFHSMKEPPVHAHTWWLPPDKL